MRKILEVSGCDPLTTELDGKPLADHLLAPTRIYVKNVLELIENVDVHAIAHLTGGGFWENIPRVLPDNTRGGDRRLLMAVAVRLQLAANRRQRERA